MCIRDSSLSVYLQIHVIYKILYIGLSFFFYKRKIYKLFEGCRKFLTDINFVTLLKKPCSILNTIPHNLVDSDSLSLHSSSYYVILCLCVGLSPLRCTILVIYVNYDYCVFSEHSTSNTIIIYLFTLLAK